MVIIAIKIKVISWIKILKSIKCWKKIKEKNLLNVLFVLQDFFRTLCKENWESHMELYCPQWRIQTFR